MKRLLFLFLSLAACRSATPDAPQATCVWSEAPIRVNGAPDDAVWATAPRMVLAAQSEGDFEGASAQCAWSPTGMALFAVLNDRDITASVTEHDGRTWDDDVLEWFLEPARGGPYIELHVNPLNTTLDLLLPAPEGVDARTSGIPEFHLQTEVRLQGTLSPGDTDQLWAAEMFVPWSDIPGGKPESGAVWRGHVARYDRSSAGDPVLSSTADFDPLDFHRRDLWRPLVFSP